MPNALSITKKLLDNKLITSEQVAQVELECAKSGETEEEVLLKFKIADLDQITKIKGEIYNTPFVNLAETGTVPEALELVPRQVAEQYVLFPFSLSNDKKTLSVAFYDPFNASAINFVEAKSGKIVKPFIALQEDILKTIKEKYSSDITAQVSGALKEIGEQPQTKAEIILDDKGKVIRKENISNIVKLILEFALSYRASDVHIEPEDNSTRIRYRIDGILHEKLSLPKTIHEALISRIKVLSDMKIDEKRLPQDGRFNFRANGQEVDLRVSTLPTVLGEKVVMRLLKKSGGVPTLPELGLRGRALKDLEEAILRPHGIILICGPTGSGKTTTLYSVLSKINTTKVNIVTLEDPVEYKIAGVNQVQINPGAGLTFASGLRSFLRQDPNIIMVGEIRDSETTDLAIQASLTGHLVFSTIHTKSASQALPRLLDLNAEPFLLASTITAIVAQRICRKICLSCKQTDEATQEIKQDIENILGSLITKTDKIILSKGAGCPECNNTGYFGRIGIFEVLPVSEKIARLIMEKAPAIDVEKTAIEEGMITLKQDGYLKVVEAVTTIEEVLRVAQD